MVTFNRQDIFLGLTFCWKCKPMCCTRKNWRCYLKRNFMFQLTSELREAHVQGKMAALAAVLPPLCNNYQNSVVDSSRKQKQCQLNVNCEQNKTAKFCCGCCRSVCNKCTSCVKVECVD